MSDYKRNPRSARRARKSLSRKALVVLSLMMVLAVAAVGGTVAWLTSTPAAVTNTFTTAGIEITLIETKNPDGTENKEGDVVKPVTNWSAQLVPGKTYAKNPVVSVVRPETDVDIYLFVKVDEKNMTVSESKDYLQYQLTLTGENGWTNGTGEDGIPTNVWYRTVTADSTALSWQLLVGDQVQVNPELTKEEIPDKNSPNLPSLTFTAYAIQVEGFDTPAKAWTEVSN